MNASRFACVCDLNRESTFIDRAGAGERLRWVVLLQHTMLSDQRISSGVPIGDSNLDPSIARFQQLTTNGQVVIAGLEFRNFQTMVFDRHLLEAIANVSLASCFQQRHKRRIESQIFVWQRQRQ